MPFRIQVLLGGEICAAIGALVQPFWGLLFLILLTFMRPQDDRPNMSELHIPMVMTWAVIVGTVARTGLLFQRAPLVLKALAPYMGLLALMACSAVVNGYSVYSQLQLDESLTVAIVCGLLLVWITTEDRCRLMIYTILMSGLYYVNTVLRNPTFIHEEIGGESFDRITLKNGTNFGNPNFLAVLMVIVFFLALALVASEHRRWMRALALAAVAGYLYVFLRCQSRGATLGISAGLLVFWALQRRKALTGVIIAGTAAIGLSFLAPATFLTRLQTMINYQEDRSATGRLEMWGLCRDVIVSNPVLGMGPGNFEPTYPEMSPHNAYLQVASEVGVPALFVYLALLCSGYRSAWIARRLCAAGGKDLPYLHKLSEALLCVLVELTVQGCFTGFAFRECVYITLTLTYVIRALAESSGEREEPAEPPAVPSLDCATA